MSMQTPKARTVFVEVTQRTSPSTTKTARKLRTSGTAEVDSVLFPNPASRTPKDRSPKVIGRRSPQSPAIEVALFLLKSPQMLLRFSLFLFYKTQQKRPGRMSSLEDQLAQLQEEVRAAKEQLSLSESLKKTSHKRLMKLRSSLQQCQKSLRRLRSSCLSAQILRKLDSWSYARSHKIRI
ncbi:hypothetical protein CQW23_24130 [Capsicum baccatum]|uniref:Uncharacterized protein n=1 Tax=Capsicum baccatum TaxID=33114 RepID=A0A2G2VTW6_CAPBA|nr:hypothetical protein CQW23_24130 [Capsicum baccatum]